MLLIIFVNTTHNCNLINFVLLMTKLFFGCTKLILVVILFEDYFVTYSNYTFRLGIIKLDLLVDKM